MKSKVFVILFTCFITALICNAAPIFFIEGNATTISDTTIKKGSFNLDDALKGTTLSAKNNTENDTSPQPSYKKFSNPETQPAIKRTPEDTGTKYDKGYINSLDLKKYRAENRDQEINSYLELIAKVATVVALLLIIVFLIRFTIKKWVIIKKFFKQ